MLYCNPLDIFSRQGVRQAGRQADWQTGRQAVGLAGRQALQAGEGRDDQVGSKNVVEGG